MINNIREWCINNNAIKSTRDVYLHLRNVEFGEYVYTCNGSAEAVSMGYGEYCLRTAHNSKDICHFPKPSFPSLNSTWRTCCAEKHLEHTPVAIVSDRVAII